MAKPVTPAVWRYPLEKYVVSLLSVCIALSQQLKAGCHIGDKAACSHSARDCCVPLVVRLRSRVRSGERPRLTSAGLTACSTRVGPRPTPVFGHDMPAHRCRCFPRQQSALLVAGSRSAPDMI
ncbi:hypothetical protein NDU88_005733 [Pleurodeles waltl]|uniref:Secreted protein n=1 Tax=Pleurodeles waltl TaxID=8319 RepID=A0AAV7RQ24_PLEWA|nr:hypothetical protein NDU88_005733 [Pleurodeles waltl]